MSLYQNSYGQIFTVDIEGWVDMYRCVSCSLPFIRKKDANMHKHCFEITEIIEKHYCNYCNLTILADTIHKCPPKRLITIKPITIIR